LHFVKSGATLWESTVFFAEILLLGVALLAMRRYIMGKGVRTLDQKRRPADKRQTPMFYSAG